MSKSLDGKPIIGRKRQDSKNGLKYCYDVIDKSSNLLFDAVKIY